MSQIPKYIREGLEKQGPNTLRAIIDLAEQILEEKERELEEKLEEQAVDEDEVDELGDPPEGAPGSVCVTVKTIDDNDYYYWQWRDGDKIKSEYIKPVSPS